MLSDAFLVLAMTNALEPLDDVVDLPHVHVLAPPLRLRGRRVGDRAGGRTCVNPNDHRVNAGDAMNTGTDRLQNNGTEPIPLT